MKKEYDFSKAERGKFYRPGAKLNIPIYLREDVQRYVREEAKSKGVEVADLVGEIVLRHARAEGHPI